MSKFKETIKEIKKRYKGNDWKAERKKAKRAFQKMNKEQING